MKSILIIGLGRFGKYIAAELNELNHEVMGVDKDEQRVNDVLPMLTDAQIGNAANKAFLQSLGVDNFDVCYVAIGDDFESSLIVTNYLKELGARKVIARASREVQRKLLLRNGADDVLFPEKQLAEWTALRHTTDHVLDYIALDDQFAIYDLSVPEEWTGRTVGEMDIRKRFHLNLLAIRGSGSPSIEVTSDTRLEADQTILVLGRWKDVQKCFKL